MNPESEIVMDFVGRHLHQEEHLYAAIQTNFEMEKAHAAFLAAANRLYSTPSKITLFSGRAIVHIYI
jgi:hypothetical protein